MDDRARARVGVVDGGLKHVLVHSISDDAFMGELAPASKYNADWDFLLGLRDNGRREADAWLTHHYRNVGQRSSIDIREEFL